MKNKRILVLSSLAAMVGLLLAALSPLLAQALDRTVSQRVMKSVVQIIAASRGRSGGLTSKWTGSGTIVSSDGLILTNCHVAKPRAMWDDPRFDYDVLIVAITGRSDEPPQPTYLAEVVQYDPGLDLAVIRITQYLDGRKVDPAKLNLSALPLGDSDDLEVGDPLYIFGFPGIGGETITFTSGNVSGFTREQGVTGRAWIKTDATIAGGNSGGTGVNEKGELVGVPTQGGSGSGEQVVDCRYIADTNGDGTVDENDSCVPMGGFINALRPVNLAKPMIEAARRGLSAPPPSPQPTPVPPSGKPSVSRLIFAPAVNDYDQPVTVVDAFPSGTEEIYLLFDYKNFSDGAAWQPVLTYNNKTYNDIWQVSNWSGGPAGTWWISIQNSPLSDGTYKFDLLYEGKSLGSATVQVGGKAQNKPTFRNIVFSSESQTGYVLPAGAKEVKATFEYANMTSRTAWSYIWYRDGSQTARGTGPALSAASGSAWVSISSASGLQAGNYRLELFIEGKLAATSDFLIGGKAGGTGASQLFGPIVFAEGVDRSDKPVRPGTSFAYGIRELYAFFDYNGMRDGWKWVRRWYIDGQKVLETENTWQGGSSGNWWISVSNDEALPAGKYELELSVEGATVQRGSCTIDSTGRPTPTPTRPANGVEVYGRISDADTGKGIQGAIFLVLKPGLSIAEFTWSDDEVYTYAETDRYGEYRLALPLLRGETYSMIVAASGYSAIMEDDITIRSDLKSPYELNLTLRRVK